MKSRTGKECKKTECKRHKNYLAWNCGDSELKYCMECKNAHVSQYDKGVKPKKLTAERSTNV